MRPSLPTWTDSWREPRVKGKARVELPSPRHEPRGTDPHVPREQGHPLDDAGRRDQLVGRLATEVEIAIRMADGVRQGPNPAWEEEYRSFRERDLSEEDYVYVWADGIHFRVRLEDDRLCTLVLLGVRSDGTKELIAVEDGYWESVESWSSVLRDLKRRGMRVPVLAIGDGALGLWWRCVTSGLKPQSSAAGCIVSHEWSTSCRSDSRRRRDHVRRILGSSSSNSMRPVFASLAIGLAGTS